MQTFKLTPKPQSDYRLEVNELKKQCKLEKHGYRHNKIIYGFCDKVPEIAELQSLGLNVEKIPFEKAQLSLTNDLVERGRAKSKIDHLAVKQAEKYVGKEDFILHGGDVTILSKHKHPILRLIETAKKNPDAKVILLCKKIKDSKRYGVPTVSKVTNNIFNVKEVIEKPDKPKSQFGILPLYYFKSDIFSSLKKIKLGKGKEFQLTDAIQNLIENKKKVLVITLNKNEEEVDVGTVKSYRNAQDITFRKA